MPLNRDLLGKIHRDREPLTVTAERVAAYVDATNADPAVYTQRHGGELLAPPSFGVVVSHEVMVAGLTDPELHADLPRLLHSDQVMRFHQPLRIGDRLFSEAEVSRFDEKRTGELLDLTVRIHREDGSLVYEGILGLFFRYEERKPSSELAGLLGATREDPERLPADAELLFEAAVEVAADQARRYADASGDRNPIHIDEDFARSVGLPGCILHGLCTLAMAQHAVIAHAAGNDPRRLRALRGRFSRPVALGDRLTTQARRGAQLDGVLQLGYEVVNQEGKAVLKDGRAEIAER